MTTSATETATYQELHEQASKAAKQAAEVWTTANADPSDQGYSRTPARVLNRHATVTVATVSTRGGQIGYGEDGTKSTHVVEVTLHLDGCGLSRTVYRRGDNPETVGQVTADAIASMVAEITEGWTLPEITIPEGYSLDEYAGATATAPRTYRVDVLPGGGLSEGDRIIATGGIMGEEGQPIPGFPGTRWSNLDLVAGEKPAPYRVLTVARKTKRGYGDCILDLRTAEGTVYAVDPNSAEVYRLIAA